MLQDCVDEYDKANADGLHDKVHRVAHIIFAKDTLCRQELEAFRSSNCDLRDFLTFYVILQEYALVSLVERRIEQQNQDHR